MTIKAYTKGVITTFIALAFLTPAFASASNKPVKDTTPPAITSLHIGSSNASTTVAVPGDVVTLTFTTSEPVQTPVVLVNAKPLFLRATNSTGNTWVATYTIVAKDPLGRAAWAIVMADKADNIYACTSPRIILIPYCPTTDGSSVTITKSITPPPADTTAPVISSHADVFATTTGTSAAVSYSLPTATDNKDGSVAVTCSPASGSTFSLGTTPVNCSAHDAAGNTATSTFNVVVTQVTVPDTQAPVIAPHASVFATTTGNSADVSYVLPTATDDRDGPVAVTCSPASGSTFSLGTTTVNCSAVDAAGNAAASSFAVNVKKIIPPGTPVTLAAQSDDTYVCGFNTGTWRGCEFNPDNTLTAGFTPGPNVSVATINLGLGSSLNAGALTGVTIANQQDLFSTWTVTVACFADAAYTQSCSDWLNVSRPASESVDGKYWTAKFDNGAPITFIDAHYYRLLIDDMGFEGPAYGSQSLLRPYFVVSGITQ